MTNTELNLYKTLFRKKNLKELNISIPSYAQPLSYVALELDETLREILCMLCYIGTDVHLKTFKDFLIKEYTISEKDENNNIIEKAYTSKGTLENKLKLLEFMNLIEIQKYRIRLTTQALSYFNKVYTKTDRAATLEAKLERVTRAKLIAYTSSCTKPDKKNDKYFEDLNIYRNKNTFVVLKSNDRETFNKYAKKLKEIRFYVSSKIADGVSIKASNYMKNKNIDDIDFKALELNDANINIKIENAIYENYKNDIDKIFEKKTIRKEWGSKTCAKIDIIFNIETY